MSAPTWVSTVRLFCRPHPGGVPLAVDMAVRCMRLGEEATVIGLEKGGELNELDTWRAIRPHAASYDRSVNGQPMSFKEFSKKAQAAKKRLERWRHHVGWKPETKIVERELYRVSLLAWHRAQFLTESRTVWTRPLDAPDVFPADVDPRLVAALSNTEPKAHVYSQVVRCSACRHTGK